MSKNTEREREREGRRGGENIPSCFQPAAPVEANMISVSALMNRLDPDGGREEGTGGGHP